jgi:molybdopterin-guanine dinucleotide biosynthesis protein A
LVNSETEINIVLSCDVPLINTLTINELILAFDDSFDIVQFQIGGKSMPLTAIYKKQCANHFYNLLEAGERRLRVAVEQCNTRTIDAGPDLEQCLSNVNSKYELLKLRDGVKS